MTDPFYTLNRINMELNNLQRGHVYYSIDEQPEVCAALIAQGIKGTKSTGSIKADIADNIAQFQEEMGRRLKEAMGPIVEEFIHRVSVTVQSWDDVPAATRLIRERQREFKKRNNL